MAVKTRLHELAKAMGTTESMIESYRNMFSGITDEDAAKLVIVFRSENMTEYQQKLSEAKRQYSYTEPQLVFEDGLPSWEL